MQEATPSLMNQQIDALLYNEHNLISNLSNASALLNQSLEDINWAGFYLYQEDTDELMLGPSRETLPVCIFRSVTASAAQRLKKKKRWLSKTSTSFLATLPATPQVTLKSWCR